MRQVSVAVLLLVLPLTVAAQRITITPTVGYYSPLRDQLYEYRTTSSSTGYSDDTVYTKLETAVVMGLKLAVELNSWSGLELSGATAEPRRRESHNGLRLPLGLPPLVVRSLSRSSFLAVQFLVHRPLTRALGVTVGAGPNLTLLTGLGYDQNGPASRRVFGVTASTTLSFTLGTRTRLDLGLRDYAYSLEFGEPGPPPEIRESRTQHDLVTSVGIAIALRR